MLDKLRQGLNKAQAPWNVRMAIAEPPRAVLF